MIQATVNVDLPGVETDRWMGPLEWVRSLMGAKIDLRSGQEELTVGAFTLVSGLWDALGRCGVHDAISFLVDRRVIYLDRNEATHDLGLVKDAAIARGILEKRFKEMHLVCSHREGGLHILVDLRVTAKVAVGEPELEIRLSARPEALRIQPGESATAYADRVRDFTANEAVIDAHRHQVDALAHALGQAIQQEIAGARPMTAPARVQVVRPAARSVGRFGDLPFGDDVTAPQYRPTPTHARAGAHADPFVYFWYDPYWDLTSWILIDSMLHHHRWQSDQVSVVDTTGATLFTGASAPEAAASDWMHGAISVDGGGISVDADAVGHNAGFDAAGWGASDAGSSDGGWGGSDAGSSDSGSSDSGGSSCGSSCGGGGD